MLVSAYFPFVPPQWKHMTDILVGQGLDKSLHKVNPRDQRPLIAPDCVTGDEQLAPRPLSSELLTGGRPVRQKYLLTTALTLSGGITYTDPCRRVTCSRVVGITPDTPNCCKLNMQITHRISNLLIGKLFYILGYWATKR